MQNKILYWIIRLIPSLIMLQTLFYKFSAAPESIYIFSTLHAEPYGRISAGITELIAAILLLVPRSSVYGAALAVGIMGGALLSHLFVLGINVENDGGTLFVLCLITLISSLFVLWEEKKVIIKRLSFIF